MNVITRPPSPGNPELTTEEFERIAAVAKRIWGLHLENSKKPLIQSRLRKRLIHLNLSSFADYCGLIEKADGEESKQFVGAITTNVTHFYREVHHFDLIEKTLLPDMIAKARSGRRVRIWSAGCSSGQEPYSLAGSILSVDPRAGQYDLKILATDVDAQVLKTAQTARYKEADLSFPTPQHSARLFGKTKSTDGWLSILPEVKSLVTYKPLNLMAKWPFSGPFEIIMCRNVAIYFDKPTQAKLWAEFAKYLAPNGHLFIGHSERINAPNELNLIPAGTTTYKLTKTA